MTEQPDINLVLLDLSLPNGNGFAVLEELRRHCPTTAVLLSANQDRSNVARALELGASGYIPKSARREVMLSAIQLVLAGGIYTPLQILEREAAPEAAATRLDRGEPNIEETARHGRQAGDGEEQRDIFAARGDGSWIQCYAAEGLKPAPPIRTVYSPTCPEFCCC